jgi:5-methylthioribose kinase
MTSQPRLSGVPGADQYRVLRDADLRAYLAQLPEVVARLGGSPQAWSVSEVGDGNLNLVFIVKGTVGGLAVKQALPYVRLVGESWPLPLSRSHYEYQALVHQARLAPGLVPTVLHHNEALALIAMELLEPHIVLRKGLVAGIRYPRLVDHITTFLARTLFLSSDLAVPAAQKKQGIAAFAGNHALCKITEDLIFTEPYFQAEQNRWTSPWLDATAAGFREDLDLHVAISRLKLKFMARPEALIHGDLHTGSIMVTESETRAIDPEFAFYGPMGFDLGAIIGNLVMSYLASAGHERTPGERRAFEAWVLETTDSVWNQFAVKFTALWRDQAAGDAYPAALFAGQSGAARLQAERQLYMEGLFQDTIGFAAAKIIRRILGLAHNIDFELIEDPKARAVCEARSLRLARAMLLDGPAFRSIGAVTASARQLRDWQPDFGD